MTHELVIKCVINVYNIANVDLLLGQSVIEKLVSFCLLCNCFTYNIFYHRLSGMHTGSSLSVCVAEIAMQRLENKNICLSEKKKVA